MRESNAPRRTEKPPRTARTGPAGPAEGVEMPPLAKAIVEELVLVSARPLDARWFTGRALAALESGDAAGALELATQAKQVANRSPTIREIRGVAAYTVGDFKDALSELQAFRRLTNSAVQDPRIADCYRGLGRPLRAVEFLQKHDAKGPAAALVRAGALVDAGDASGAEAALRLARLAGVEIPSSGFLPVGRLGTAARSR